MEQFITLCQQDDHFLCFFISEYCTIQEVIKCWAVLNRKIRKLIFQSDHFWKRKIQQELPIGALNKIESWRRGEYWSNENEELFKETTEKYMREVLLRTDDPKQVDQCVRRALLASRNDICALMISIYFNHAFYDINYEKCFGAKNLVSDFYIFFQFFYRLTKSKDTNRLLRYIEDKPEDLDYTKIRNTYIYSILFNSNNPLASFMDLGFESCKKPIEDANYNFFSYTYDVELVNERYRSEQINIYPFIKIADNSKQLGCFIYKYNAAYPYLTTDYGTDVYLPTDYQKLINRHEELFVGHLFKTSIMRPFHSRMFHFFKQENNPWYSGRNILNAPYSIRLYFQKRVQKSIDRIYKKLRDKFSHVDLSCYPTREEMEHLLNKNVTTTANLLEDPYERNYSEGYTNLMIKMWNRYKSVKFHKEKLFIRAIDKCFRRYMNLFILSQPSYLLFTTSRISIEKVENRSCEINYFGIGLLMIPYLTELVEFKIQNNDEDYNNICQVMERMSTQLGFANVPFISKGS